MTSSPRVDLSIIVVSWNVASLLDACLKSIYTSTTDNGPEIEIIVVDSASSDDTVSMLQSRHPAVILLPQTENVGFTLGNNIGLAQAGGRYLLLLNPDTEVIGDSLARMVRYLDENPEVGIIGPHTLNSDGTTQSTKRRFPTPALAFFESTWFQGMAPRRWLDRFYATDITDDAIADVDWVQGSALMARREVYDQIGGLDTGYVMYSEELDWCKRAKQAGWRVVYLGTAQITHHGGKSSEQVAVRMHVHFQESKLRYFRKYHGLLIATLLRGFLLFSYAWQIVLESFKGLMGSRRPMRRERVRAYWQVLRSGLRIT